LIALGSLLVLAAACSSTPTVIPTKNLDRPVDMTFVCMETAPSDTDGTTVLSGQAMDKCHPRGAVDSVITSSGLRTLGTFAFIANAGRGELAVVDMDHGRLLDLTPRAPGYGMLPVGGDPEALASSQDGCWVATANRTSCNFTLVDPSRLLAATFTTNSSQAVPATGTGDSARRLAVLTGSGRVLHASTGEIAFLPPAPPSPACQAGAVPRAVATFPGCDMVAIVDLSFEASTATIASAFYVRPELPGGFQAAGTEPSCPEECAATPGEDVAVSGMDGGVEDPDGGNPTGAGIDGGTDGPRSALHLQPLALVPDGTRVYVGSLRDTAVASFDIGDAGLSNPARIELAENPGGISRLRLGVDPFLTAQVTRPDGSTGTVVGQFLRNRGAFLYAFTADDSIRVLNLDGAVPVECDVNILATSDSRARSCFPVGSTPRRPLARGPGIRIPTVVNPDSPPPMPRDLAFADLQPIAEDANHHALSGQFAFVLTSNGYVYVLNLAPSDEQAPATATHSFRETRDVGKKTRTPLAVLIAPQRLVIQSDQAFATTATFSALDGPLIKPFSSENGATSNWFDYPDLDTIISRTWDVVWEGALPQTSRISGIVQSASGGDSAGGLGDAGADFCGSGVQAGDVLMFSGCTQNLDCQPDNEFSCQVSVSGGRGMCLPKDANASEALVSRCTRFMGSRMRYEIAQATPTSLGLRLKLDEVPKTTLNPCKQDSDCRLDVDHGLLASASPDGGLSRAFECVEVRAQDRRCVQRCTKPKSDIEKPKSDAECRAGHVCESVPWVDAAVGNLCVEAPPIVAGCFPQPMTTYSVRAGHSFTVYGSSMPSLHQARVSADGTCQYDVPRDPSLVNRIPLSAPQCPDSFLANALLSGKDPTFVQKLPAQAGSNPCLYQGPYLDGNATESPEAGSPDSQHIRAFFQNPQIRFVLTNLDAYAGDLLAIHFELRYGFVPLTVQTIPSEVLLTMGTRILVGPTKTPESPIRHVPLTDYITYPYLYVVDQGRTALTPGSRGQILRINPRAGSNEIATFDTTISGSTPFQVQ
jgi:hypothetical protein